MSESENKSETNRLADVGELNEILAFFDAGERQTNARGVNESLRLSPVAKFAIFDRMWRNHVLIIDRDFIIII